MAKQCTHTDTIAFTNTEVQVCEDCVKMGSTWVHLRMCLQCGHVACCDSSPNKHATQHFNATTHALVRSIERGENWVWCYADQMMAGVLE